jgi:uncharacterized membrane protein
MSTGTIIAIVVAAVVLMAVVVALSQLARRRRLDKRRSEARELRHKAREREDTAEDARGGRRTGGTR